MLPHNHACALPQSSRGARAAAARRLVAATDARGATGTQVCANAAPGPSECRDDGSIGHNLDLRRLHACALTAPWLQAFRSTVAPLAYLVPTPSPQVALASARLTPLAVRLSHAQAARRWVLATAEPGRPRVAGLRGEGAELGAHIPLNGHSIPAHLQLQTFVPKSAVPPPARSAVRTFTKQTACESAADRWGGLASPRSRSRRWPLALFRPACLVAAGSGSRNLNGCLSTHNPPPANSTRCRCAQKRLPFRHGLQRWPVLQTVRGRLNHTCWLVNCGNHSHVVPRLLTSVHTPTCVGALAATTVWQAPATGPAPRTTATAALTGELFAKAAGWGRARLCALYPCGVHG